MRILIVDDSRATRMIVSRVLRQAGLDESTLEEAENGQEALDIIRAGTPDLVLSDWNMPVMSGIELLRTIQAEGIVVKFGFVTSEHTPDMREQAIAGGALFLLTKPFTPDSFQEVLSAIL